MKLHNFPSDNLGAKILRCDDPEDSTIDTYTSKNVDFLTCDDEFDVVTGSGGA